ncbi:MAG: hypothetical protein IPP78_06830 [Holophagaceae bacterium]|nr:hypothetical protein [Holophagaceae bacterium]
MDRTGFLATFIAGALSLAASGCGTTKPPPAAQTPVSPASSPAPTGNPVPPVNEAAPASAPSAASVGKESPKAAPGHSSAEPSKPAVVAPNPSPANTPAPPAAAPVAAPSKPPAVSAAPAAVETAKTAEVPVTSAHGYVGPEKCMLCHKVQYTSWSQSKHKTKGLDCEGCHGNGADYKAMPVMKDHAAAVKAGLVIPGLGFCKKCHVKTDASMLPLVHAHKAK